MTDWKHFRKAGAGIIGLGSLFMASQAMADFVIADDLIVDGSACIGFDCVNGESFGFDTIRLKENNLRIKFDDTSVVPNFPSNDWQITVNESANGGQAKFSIEDITGSRTPFTIEANARSHSLYVDDGGRIGNRTSTPSVEIHTIDGDTPTLRLQQDGSSGFAPQTWDVAGNETNFFVRDVTNGSTLPIRIRPGAPSNSIFIDTDGDVGLGTSSPTGSFHVRGGESVALKLDNTGGGVSIQLDAGGEATDFWQMTSTAGDGILRFNRTGGATEFELDSSGNITIAGEITTSGSCSGGCDLVFDDAYELPSIGEHARLMKQNRYLPAVGPTPENGPFNLSQKVGGILNELEKAHLYIAELNQRLAKIEAAAKITR